MCGECCEDCCRNCCYSTPYVTLSSIGLTAIGLIGFTLAGLYGVATMNTVSQLQDGTAVMAPVVVGMAVLTLIPLALATIMGYCVTGYIRDVLFQRTVKRCIGSICCNATVMVSILFFIFLWILMAIGFGGIMVYYVQAELYCGQMTATDASSVQVAVNSTAAIADCFPYVDTGFNLVQICPEANLDQFCRDALPVGTAFSVCLVFIVIVILGLVILLSVVSTNRINAQDQLDYRSASKNNFPLKSVH